jgi:hypothetical protein
MLVLIAAFVTTKMYQPVSELCQDISDLFISCLWQTSSAKILDILKKKTQLIYFNLFKQARTPADIGANI